MSAVTGKLYHLRGRVYFTKRSRCNYYRGYPHVNVGQGWFIVATNRSLHATSRRLRNICWKIVLHTNSYDIGVRIVAMHARNSRRRKILRTTSSNLVIDVNDFEIVVYSATHEWTDEMREESEEEKEGHEREVPRVDTECKYTIPRTLVSMESQYLPDIGALMKSIDSQYLCSKYQLTRFQLQQRRRRRWWRWQRDQKVKEVRTPFGFCFMSSQQSVCVHVLRPVYLRTGARSSLRAIKHKSLVTFIPLWGLFPYSIWKRTALLLSFLPLAIVVSTLADFTLVARSPSS